ncbi:hypothetical protein [Sphingomonas sp. J344]|uniref:hypothetical protein n=1 Tax=unclassified Sphingomonas TaxID=196159 RepID=UPI0035B2865B
MKWFGRKSGREGSRPVLARGQGAGAVLGEWPQSYEAQVRGLCGQSGGAAGGEDRRRGRGGRRGTEGAIGASVAGDRFVLLDRATLAIHDDLGAAGMTLNLMATGVGDAEPVATTIAVTGRSVTPPSPVALHAVPAPGGRMIRWTRRSCADGDGAMAPTPRSARAPNAISCKFVFPGSLTRS